MWIWSHSPRIFHQSDPWSGIPRFCSRHPEPAGFWHGHLDPSSTLRNMCDPRLAHVSADTIEGSKSWSAFASWFSQLYLRRPLLGFSQAQETHEPFYATTKTTMSFSLKPVGAQKLVSGGQSRTALLLLVPWIFFTQENILSLGLDIFLRRYVHSRTVDSGTSFPISLFTGSSAAPFQSGFSGHVAGRPFSVRTDTATKALL
ncbi:hypothetical protein BD289DRAFT_220584 [Coniella lustricola]|uniref:Uncharacterized protein n=1 Tax=Coniella lustricola TaxID=2025994 RepID=A0A2T3ALP5_9PEZI|nr:hypothetical protein BD289DRAFT_220584 [Coniella lustricola]